MNAPRGAFRAAQATPVFRPSLHASATTVGLQQRRCMHGRNPMPRGSKEAYTDKQKRKAEHIEEGYEKRGVSHGEAERRAWATVNKQEGGGKKSGSGRKH
jgi:hypothetical protein